jgi:1-acyl-sn-glycerol-3-phosphate acyltransferase
MPEPTFHYEPAADLGMDPVERLRSVRREQGLVSYLAHRAAATTVATYFHLYHRLTVVGRDQLPLTPPFIIIANHASHVDAMVLQTALRPEARAVAFPVAAGDVFFTTAVSSFLSSLFINALPLFRKKVTTHALVDLRTRLQEGRSGYILFPEGARSRDRQPLPFKPGLGRLVAGTNVPVYPCHITGAFDALRPETNIPRPAKITVRVGQPATFESQPDAREGWEHVANWAKESVFALAPDR